MSLEALKRAVLQETDKLGHEDLIHEAELHVALVTQADEELGDLLGGRRSQADHPHHKPGDLTTAVINNVASMLKIRRDAANRTEAGSD